MGCVSAKHGCDIIRTITYEEVASLLSLRLDAIGYETPQIKDALPTTSFVCHPFSPCSPAIRWDRRQMKWLNKLDARSQALSAGRRLQQLVHARR